MLPSHTLQLGDALESEPMVSCPLSWSLGSRGGVLYYVLYTVVNWRRLFPELYVYKHTV